MADIKMSTPSTQKALPNVAIEHRLTHISHGHLGRIAYSPADNEDQQVGRLQTSRSTDSNHHFKLISPFKEVSPPTRSGVPEAWFDKKPSDAARSQRGWLLQSHPEAVAGANVDGFTLVDELSGLKTADAGDATSHLLAVGEITDRTDLHSGTVGAPAIAMAAGEGGHILHIVPLELEDASWADGDLSVRLPKISTSTRGQWVDDGVAITTIKFAVDAKRYDPIRWLLVQKPTGTTILDPDINVSSSHGNVYEFQDSQQYSPVSRHVSPNRLCTIKADKTGGSPHSDVCFNPVVDGRPPQLAIIDKAGQWTVWDITGSRSSKIKVLQPMMAARGSIGSGLAPSLQPKLGTGPAMHKLLYVSPRSEQRIKREEVQGDNGLQTGPFGSRPPVRFNHLLVCSSTDVRLLDAAQGTELAGIRVVNVNKAQSILDMQICPISPSEAYILTTSSLFWVDTKLVRDEQARISVISSIPHHKSADGGILTLSVSPFIHTGRAKSCIALIMSRQEKATETFILTKPSAEELAHTVHQVISVETPECIRSIYAISLPVRHDDIKQRKVDRSGDSVPSPEKTRLYQILCLSSNLSLASALLAVSDAHLQDLSAPALSQGTKQSDKLRKRFLRHMGNAFVVQDSHEERATTLPSLRPERKTPLPEQEPVVPKDHSVINLEAACERLEELTLSEIAPVKMSRQLLAGVIHKGMSGLETDDHMRLRTLSELVADKLNGCNLDTLEEEWTTFREELDMAYEGKVHVAELGTGHPPADLQSVTWQLSTLSYVNEDTPDTYKRMQRHLLRHLSGKQYLSLFGISVVPPILATTEAEDTASQPATQATDDESFLPPTPTPIRTQSGHSQDSMDIDSSAAPTQFPDPGPLARLRKYIDIATASPPSKPPATRLLSHWPRTPTDPWSFTYIEDEGPLTAEDEAAMEKRRRRDEARRRRSQKQRLSMGLPINDEDASGPSTQQQQHQGYAMTPRAAMSSQPRGREEGGGSQVPTTQAQVLRQSQSQSHRPRISMSQVMPGPHGGRPGTAKKKARKSIFR
ncbi:RNA polymerase I-specific transcription initiation factor RRN6-like protein [Coniochaeta sp. 2T2.1]|nr:RNA polymerase I-specific transcription initiation factor RRN6-like protein [Coniochaeta sp. 2T2.1]